MKNFLKFFKMVVVLTSICLISAVSLAYVYSVTKPRIDKQIEKDLLDSLKKIHPSATRFEETKPMLRWNAYKDNEIIGSIIKTTATGYGGNIQILFGMDNNKNINNVIIIEQNETPGLGTKIMEKKFLNQYTGKKQNEVSLKKDDAQNGQIDAITAATISSRAVTNAIRNAMNE